MHGTETLGRARRNQDKKPVPLSVERVRGEERPSDVNRRKDHRGAAISTPCCAASPHLPDDQGSLMKNTPPDHAQYLIAINAILQFQGR